MIICKADSKCGEAVCGRNNKKLATNWLMVTCKECKKIASMRKYIAQQVREYEEKR